MFLFCFCLKREQWRRGRRGRRDRGGGGGGGGGREFFLWCKRRAWKFPPISSLLLLKSPFSSLLLPFPPFSSLILQSSLLLPSLLLPSPPFSSFLLSSLPFSSLLLRFTFLPFLLLRGACSNCASLAPGGRQDQSYRPGTPHASPPSVASGGGFASYTYEIRLGLRSGTWEIMESTEHMWTTIEQAWKALFLNFVHTVFLRFPGLCVFLILRIVYCIPTISLYSQIIRLYGFIEYYWIELMMAYPAEAWPGQFYVNRHDQLSVTSMLARFFLYFPKQLCCKGPLYLFYPSIVITALDLVVCGPVVPWSRSSWSRGSSSRSSWSWSSWTRSSWTRTLCILKCVLKFAFSFFFATV